ncbi:U4/U6 small nuclear ribonucleoprotein PRP4 [Plasmodium brasilianum]|uniref:U4/U6 small nuclear ribonucleoprotein PRP4, putative n=2 Tax=Plasmodium (Plasmodium) TaxID=418103 RepID=A0A1A8WTI6_PLAMA|nr:U4/U6 small nuclear ribonucleoprotein PRP4, putative [Plasmodium malariae]KAI4836355.1 U4/U6 small nuclear ribonucleoprotein PRP4 [Plasmodium brasilianum]SBS95166.1 U4/U6 small nuclear ribonucleoprotein PRP4, putative [Plasmodium malariae]SCO93622.1 U4/U6 small nuclear ribonucleoprotein PRP4, putative [Plasmodium malariae]
MKISDVLSDSKLHESLKLRKSELNSSQISKDNILEEFDIKNKIRKVSLGIPTKDIDVKNVLRLLKEPICLFGEDSYDKRKRLKTVLVTKYDKLIIKKNNENEEEVEEFKNILKKYYIDFSSLCDVDSPEYIKIKQLEDELVKKRLKEQSIEGKGIDSRDKLKEKFYTESSEELKFSRLDITLKTLPRIFLYKEMINNFQNKYQKEDYENYIISYNEHMKNEFDLYISQLGDDRPLTMGKFSPDNSVFAVSSYNTYINIFNYKNDNYNIVKTLKKGHDDKINCIEWNYPNNYSYYNTLNYTDIRKKDLLLASCSSDKTFCIWRPFPGEDINDYNITHKSYFEGNKKRIRKNNTEIDDTDERKGDHTKIFEKNGHEVKTNCGELKKQASKQNGNKDEYNIEDENEQEVDDKNAKGNKYLLCKVKAHEDRINKICFHPLNKYVLTCSEDETIKFFDIETQKELFYQEGHNAIVYTATFNPYGNLYLSGDSKGGLMLWDIRTGRNIDKKQAVHNNCIMNINFNPFMPNMFCTCSSDNTIKIFDLRNFKISCNILAHNKIVTDAIFEPTYGRYITSCSFDTFIKIWDSVNFYCTKILYNNENKVRNVDISPDGKFISSTSFDRTWKLYKNTEFVQDNILSHLF